MTHYLRLILYNRWPKPHYKPLGPDTASTEYPPFKQGSTYRLRLARLYEDESTWPMFVVVKPASESIINDLERPCKTAILVEVFTVLLSEYEQFVEPYEDWEMN